VTNPDASSTSAAAASPWLAGPLARHTSGDHAGPRHQDAAQASAASSGSGSQGVILVERLTKVYHLGQTRVPALRGVTLEIARGEFVAIQGPSGSGKSTFMNLIGCLDRPSSGTYWLNGTEVSRLSADRIADVRNRRIGFVFQGFNLLPRATALANVALPLAYAGIPRDERERRARRALRVVGLEERIHHRPLQLSGGQQQRVAIARALVNAPALLLADEPTGNLDSRTAVEVMAVLQHLNTLGLTTVLVTHEPDVAVYARRQITFRDGRVIRDEAVRSPRSAAADLLALRADPPTAAEPSSVRIREELTS
jgi:putative ABC transport system ATP-binding protein